MSTPHVLAIHAHPDDVEIQCAGTLLLLRRRGCRVTLATLCTGDLGSATLPPAEIAAVRAEEARRSAALLGAEYHCLGKPDCSVVFSNELRRELIGFLRRVVPDVIITAPPQDYMAEHEETSRLVKEAALHLPVSLLPTLQPGGPATPVPPLYYTGAVGGTDAWGRPLPVGALVDITSVMDDKEAMLACHVSQREWLRIHFGMDQYILAMKQTAAELGKRIGVRYAEPLSQHLGFGFPHENVLGEVLGDLMRPMDQEGGAYRGSTS